MNKSPNYQTHNFIYGGILGTIGGWILAFVLGVGVLSTWELFASRIEMSRQVSDVISIVLVLFALAVVGASIGAVQWSLALKTRLPRTSWIFVSAITGITGAIGFGLGGLITPGFFSVTSSEVSGFYDTYTLSNTWFINVLTWSLIFGAAIGVPRWLLLRRKGFSAISILPANIIAGLVALGIFATLITLMNNDFLAESLTICITPLTFGLITGYTLSKVLLSKKENKSDT